MTNIFTSPMTWENARLALNNYQGVLWNIDGYIQRSSGNVISSTDYKCTGFIPIDRQNDLIVTGYEQSSAVAIAAYYDTDKQFISARTWESNGYKTITLTPADIPVNAKFIRCSTINSGGEGKIIGIGDSSIINYIHDVVDKLPDNSLYLMKKDPITTDFATTYAKDLSQGIYRTSSPLIDFPPDEYVHIGTVQYILVVISADYGKLFFLQRHTEKSTARRYFIVGRFYAGESEITWNTFVSNELSYNANREVVLSGDSIAARLFTESPKIKHKTNVILVNNTEAGTTFAYRPTASEVWDPLSFVARTDSANDDTFDIDDANMFLVWYGINDKTADIPLGLIDSIDNQTIAGAINNGIANLRTRNPILDIVFITPNANPYSEAAGSAGYTLSELCEHIKLVANNNKCQCLDLYTISGIDDTNKATILPDNLHPTQDYLGTVALNKICALL